MDDDQQLRYSRHLLLDEWSEAAQERLLNAHALVIGAGGLGAPALMYLASCGVGRITVVDPDTVDLTNLQRQIAHTTARIGQPKVLSAELAMAELNPGVQVHAIAEAADEALLDTWVPQAQVVLDCTDRFAIRQTINRACRTHGVPLVSASAVRFDGQISVFDPRVPTSPCYACLFPPDAPPEETRCALMGVFAPVVGMMGVMQAGEAIKLLTGLHEPGVPGHHQSLAGRLLLLDGRDWSWTTLRAHRSPDCPVCGPAT
ncbi:HesA/MoeB/ThiF family protein [Aquabacterium sp.]|uniref:HesA/MoeB/ThiF family protein n=1 Tax=Aquabacterium sp. TaxID=1872578 RepID=UPI0011D51E1E|nr:HesA/MoeB/ThiF family protein [Aquabacterium sp.]MBP6614365.1 HesA/MoeB/ThiF family protein [Aquabacterium sp.]MBP7502053.1 HesA/MoeB/ThiF family protein [Aquabacterium sp.]MCC6219484.1 HesA/MoeB/ThiF family protein [Aquabacterium sp.]MDD2976570.1 HesA/MoeB/ThiF family protein [Aquabacterium sp.]TXI95415.1 MAG: HesA/MoeB/ThiF family protein [Aquabacterium sp.]